ncbi:MAG TPA: spermidine/putrescine ABC transporter substrate-binding protein [Actinomycetes bacterium]|nr:spermidine/putrescine ABC transporter substrate-binding protein [Actinomycetes bacterium]
MSNRNFDLPIVPGVRPTGLSRRGVLQALGVGGVALAGGSLLSACGTEGTSQEPGGVAAEDKSDVDKVVNFSNWVQYIDVDDKNEKLHPTLKEFEDKTGIKVKYKEDINDNDEFFGQIRPLLEANQDTGRDIVVFTDWMAGRMIRLGWVQELNKANIPNAVNLQPNLQNVGFDQGRKQSLPWQSGFTGIGINRKAVRDLGVDPDSINSIDALLNATELKGKVTALTEMRDTMGLTMLSMGKDPNNFTDDDFSAAIEKLQQAVDSGHIRGFTGNDYVQGLETGDLAACLAWSGDVIQLNFANEEIKLVTPEQGQMMWSDNMMIPNLAQHKKNAELLMNHYYDPKVAAQLAAWVNYICPVKGAREEMESIDPSLMTNPLIFPDQATLDKSNVFMALDEETERKYNEQFQALIGN